MPAIKRAIGRKAAKSTVKHSLRGVTSKGSRRPMRSLTLLAIGFLLGGLAVWLAGRPRETGAAQLS